MNISRISVSNSARDEIDREFEPKFSIYQKTLPRVGNVTFFVDVYDNPEKGIPYDLRFDGETIKEGKSLLKPEEEIQQPHKFVMLDITHLIAGNYSNVDYELRQARGPIRICKWDEFTLMLVPTLETKFYQYDWDKSGYFYKRDGERQYIPPFFYAQKGSQYDAFELDREVDELPFEFPEETLRIIKDIKSSDEKMEIINDIFDEVSGNRLSYDLEQWEEICQNEDNVVVNLNKDKALRLRGIIKNCFYGGDSKIAGINMQLFGDDNSFCVKAKSFEINKEIVMHFDGSMSNYGYILGIRQEVNCGYILSELVGKEISIWLMPQEVTQKTGAFIASAMIFIEGWLYQSKTVKLMADFEVSQV